MKILICKNSFAGPLSGADEIAVTYAVELKNAGHSTSVLLVHHPAKDDPFVPRLRAAGVPLTTLASPTFSTSLAAGRKLAIRAMRACSPASGLIRSNSRKLVFDLLQRYHDACCKFLRDHRPDVIHVMTPDPGAVMLIRAAHETGIPIIYQEVGIPFHPPGFEEVYERFVSVLPLCTFVASLSPSLAQQLRRAVPQLAQTHVLPLIALDHNGTPPRSPDPQNVTFGFAARLEHLKGPMQLIEAFGIAHRAQWDIALKIAGEGSQRKQIVERARELGLNGKCDLVGTYLTLEARSQFMHGIDVMVLPSLTEGTPNSIIEAMSHGKPIIATSVGGVPDVVDDELGILVPPENQEALAAAISRLAADPGLRHRMGLAARKKYEELFTSRAVLPLLVDFYERVIDEYAATSGANGRLSKPRPQAKLDHPWFLIHS